MSLYDETTTLRVSSGYSVRALVKQGGHSRRCLLLHGNPGCLTDWQFMLGPLSDMADVVAVDLPGFGRTERKTRHSSEVSLSRMADLVAEIGDALGWKTFAVIGHSHGGGIAQLFAGRYPHRVEGIILLATLAFPAHTAYRLLALPGATLLCSALEALVQTSWARPLATRIVRSLLRDAFFPASPTDASVEELVTSFAERPGMSRTMSQVTHGGPCSVLASVVGQIRCPVVLVHGREDRLVPVAYAENIHRRLVETNPESHLCLLPGAGHMLLASHAVDVCGIIQSFLAPAPSGSSPQRDSADRCGP